jgi:hypothetical protein
MTTIDPVLAAKAADLRQEVFCRKKAQKTQK